MARPLRTLLRKKQATKDKYILEVDGKDTGFLAKEILKDGTIKWYPFKYYQNYTSPQKKYSQIDFIGTDYKKIPSSGFSTNINTGYGFTKDQGVEKFFRFLEDNMISRIIGVMFTEGNTRVEKNILFININDFFKLKLRTRQYTESTRRELKHLHKTLGSIFLPNEIKPASKLVYMPGLLGRFFEKYANESIKLDKDEAKKLLPFLEVDKQLIVSTKRAIDKIYIEDVLGDFDKLMKSKTDSKNLEEKWHKFFKKHNWIFSSVFAYPTVYFKDKLNVGGHDITGGTDKIIDFLLKNQFTKNITFIEIKTHLTKIVGANPYRKPSIYSMNSSLSGAIVQVMDQKNTFLKKFDGIRGKSNIDSLNSNCLVVIGDTRSLKRKGQLESFELFRLGNKDVSIITFDELKEKMEALLKIFTRN